MKKLSRFNSILAGLSLSLSALLCPAENIAEGEVYVVDQNTSLEHAIGQALAENQPGPALRFWLVISGSAVTQVTASGTTPAQQELIHRARRRGGLIYACQPDLIDMEIAPSELLSGVQAIRGFGTGREDLPLLSRTGEIPLPHSDKKTRLILRVCAEHDMPAAVPSEQDRPR
jgi:hypothetical protein